MAASVKRKGYNTRAITTSKAKVEMKPVKMDAQKKSKAPPNKGKKPRDGA